MQGAADPPTFTLFVEPRPAAPVPSLPGAQAPRGVRVRRRSDQAPCPATFGVAHGRSRAAFTRGPCRATSTRRPRSSRASTSCSSATASALLLDQGSFVEDGLLANAAGRRSARRRRGHRRRPRRRPRRVRDGQRPDGEGRLVGRPHGREDRAAHRVRAAPRAAGLLADRLGRRPHHRSGRAVPRPARRGPHLRQPGAAVGQGAAGVLPVRPVGGRRRLHPGFCDVVFMVEGNASMYLGLAAHGRGGHRRAGRRSRRWAARGCTRRCRAAATTSPSTTPTRSSRPSAGSRTCPVELARGVDAVAAIDDRPASAHRGACCPSEEAAGYDMHRVLDGAVDAGSLFEVKPLWAPELIVGFARLDGHPSASWPTTRCTKAACCSSTRPTKRARFIWLCDAFNLPLLFLADVPGFMIGTRSSGRASSATAPR